MDMRFKREKKNRRLNRGRVLDVKLRSDRARAMRLRLATTALGVTAGTVFGLYLLWRTGEWALDAFVYDNPEFAVQRVEVQTNGAIAPDLLRRWSGVRPGANLIALDLAAVKRNLELVSTIRSVSVERILPHTLRIRVAERVPVAQVDVPRAVGAGSLVVSVFQLDADGFVMQPLDPRRCLVPLSQVNPQLPVLTGVNVYQLQPGHQVESSQAQAALRFLVAFGHSPMAGLTEVRSIDVSSPEVLVLSTGRGSRITFGLEHLNRQLRRWREIYDLGRQMNKAIALADLSVSNNVPVRWMDIRATPAAPPSRETSAHNGRKNV
ncbi:MAG: FtsQ-type POTRA domain-containing protein [Verrucomicrobiota bacterium]|nr:FtsQ-type POTRA domain-containing protein [Verrucomicrobiota bacterium]